MMEAVSTFETSVNVYDSTAQYFRRPYTHFSTYADLIYTFLELRDCRIKFIF
jgi:hypothetical protein